MNVLIKDAQPITALGLKQLVLKNLGASVKVDTTNAAEQVLEFLQQREYTLVIIDSTSSFQETGTLIKQIRSNCKTCNILIYGDLKSKPYELQFVSYGASGFITRDCSEKEIISAIHLISKGQLYISQEAFKTDRLNLHFSKKTSGIKKLSKREYQVFELLIKGKSVSDICETLGLKQATISTIKKRIMIKCNVSNLVELIRLADNYIAADRMIA